MDFYHTPTSCSQATHIMLREARLDFRPHVVDIFTTSSRTGQITYGSTRTAMCRP